MLINPLITTYLKMRRFAGFLKEYVDNSTFQPLAGMPMAELAGAKANAAERDAWITSFTR